MRIAALDAAEATIRRHGLARTRLVDVAQTVGVSAAMLYRLFPDRAALVDAVSARWLSHIDAELAAIAAGADPAPARVRGWFLALHRLKCAKVKAEPEIYAAFNANAQSASPAVAAHLATMRGQLQNMVAAAIAEGAFAPAPEDATATLLFEATLAFHHPRLVLDRIAEPREEALAALLDVLIAGLAPTHR